MSVLTGLQAAHELLARAGPPGALLVQDRGVLRGRPRSGGDGLRRRRPRGATPVRLVGRDRRWLRGTEGGRFGRARTAPGRGGRGVLPRRARGRTDRCRRRWTWPAIAYTGPTVPGAALGMDKLAFGGRGVRRPGCRRCRGSLLDAETADPGFDGPYIVKPRFGGSSIGIEVVADVATARNLLGSSPHLRAGAILEPYRSAYFDVQVGVRSWPTLELSAIERPLRTSGRPGDPRVHRQVRRRRGHGQCPA